MIVRVAREHSGLNHLRGMIYLTPVVVLYSQAAGLSKCDHSSRTDTRGRGEDRAGQH